MSTIIDGNRLTLLGTVGDLSFWYDDNEGGFDSASVMNALAQMGRNTDIEVVINSGGGIAYEGTAINAILSGHKGKKTVIVQGIAASAASVIAMAGDEIMMSPGALMMIHDPRGVTVGTVADHEAQIVSLNALADSVAGIYSDRTGRTAEECRAEMRQEIWLTPQDAVEQKYATGIVAKSPATQEIQPAAFNYSLYKHPPSYVMSLTQSREWDRRRTPMAHLPSHTKGNPAMALNPEQQAAVDAEIRRREQEIKDRTTAEVTSSVTASLSTNSVPAEDAAKIVAMCNEAGVPGYAAGLLRNKVSLSDATAKVADAKQILSVVTMARKRQPTLAADFAATMISEGRSLDYVKGVLLDHMVQESNKQPISGSFTPADTTADAADVQQEKAMRDSMNKTLASMGMKPATA